MLSRNNLEAFEVVASVGRERESGRGLEAKNKTRTQEKEEDGIESFWLDFNTFECVSSATERQRFCKSLGADAVSVVVLYQSVPATPTSVRRFGNGRLNVAGWNFSNIPNMAGSRMNKSDEAGGR